jgi:hypothetical protein
MISAPEIEDVRLVAQALEGAQLVDADRSHVGPPDWFVVPVFPSKEALS